MSVLHMCCSFENTSPQAVHEMDVDIIHQLVSPQKNLWALLTQPSGRTWKSLSGSDHVHLKVWVRSLHNLSFCVWSLGRQLFFLTGELYSRAENQTGERLWWRTDTQKTCGSDEIGLCLKYSHYARFNCSLTQLRDEAYVITWRKGKSSLWRQIIIPAFPLKTDCKTWYNNLCNLQ